MAAPRRPLGQTLLARGILTQDQLRIALMEQKARSVPLGRTLVQLGFLSEATLREVLAENLGHHHIDLTRLVPSPAAVRLVPRDFARRHAVFPVSVDETRRTLRIACANPNNVVTIDQLNAQLKGRYRLEPRDRRRGRDRQCDRPALRQRTVDRRDPERDRDRRDRCREPRGRRSRIQRTDRPAGRRDPR